MSIAILDTVTIYKQNEWLFFEFIKFRIKKHLKISLAQSLWVSWCTQRFVWALWSSLTGMGFDSNCDFSPLTVVLWLLLCPWRWVSFFGEIQHSPADSCSAASCNFEVLTWEDQHKSFYSAILYSVSLLLFNNVKSNDVPLFWQSAQPEGMILPQPSTHFLTATSGIRP